MLLFYDKVHLLLMASWAIEIKLTKTLLMKSLLFLVINSKQITWENDLLQYFKLKSLLLSCL